MHACTAAEQLHIEWMCMVRCDWTFLVLFPRIVFQKHLVYTDVHIVLLSHSYLYSWIFCIREYDMCDFIWMYVYIKNIYIYNVIYIYVHIIFVYGCRCSLGNDRFSTIFWSSCRTWFYEKNQFQINLRYRIGLEIICPRVWVEFHGCCTQSVFPMFGGSKGPTLLLHFWQREGWCRGCGCCKMGGSKNAEDIMIHHTMILWYGDIMVWDSVPNAWYYRMMYYV